MKQYKLYTINNEYKCKVNTLELAFLFGVSEAATLQEINEQIKPYNYYIK